MKRIEFECDNCGMETSFTKKSEKTKQDIPIGWISIQIKMYENDSIEKRKLCFQANMDEQHFCSKECFTTNFFTDEEC